MKLKGKVALVTGAASGKIEMHTAVVDVPDPRVDKLAEMFKPKKTIYAKVTYVDIAGLDGSNKGSISGALLNQLSQIHQRADQHGKSQLYDSCKEQLYW